MVPLLLAWAMVVGYVSPVHDPQWTAPSTSPPLSINLDLQLADSHVMEGQSTTVSVTPHLVDAVVDRVTVEMEFSPTLEFDTPAGPWSCSERTNVLTCASDHEEPPAFSVTVRAGQVDQLEIAGIAGRISIGPLPDERVSLTSEISSHQDLVMLSIHPSAQATLTPVVMVDGVDHRSGGRIDHLNSSLSVVGKNESGVALEAGAELAFTLTPNYSGLAQFTGWDCESDAFEANTPLQCSLTTTDSIMPGQSSPALSIDIDSDEHGEWDVGLETNGQSSFLHGFRVGAVDRGTGATGALYASSHIVDGTILLSGHNTTSATLPLLALFLPGQVDGCVRVGIGASALDVCELGTAPSGSDSPEISLTVLAGNLTGLVLDTSGTTVAAPFSAEGILPDPSDSTLVVDGPHSVGSGNRVQLTARASNGGVVAWRGDVPLEVSRHGSRVSFIAPEVSTTQALTFTAELTDSPTPVTEDIVIVVHPTHTHPDPLDYRTLPEALTGGTVSPAAFEGKTFFRPAAVSDSPPTISLNGGATTLQARTGVALTLAARVSNLAAPVTYSWTADAGSTMTHSGDTASFSSATPGTYQVDVTASGGGRSVSTSIEVTVSSAGAPSAATCTSVGSLTAGNDSVTFGPLTISGLTSAATPIGAGACGPESGVTLTNASASLFGFVTITGVSGTIDPVGVSLTQATLSLDGLTGFGAFLLDDGLSATWNEAGELTQISGSAIATTFSYLELPSGFSPALRLRMSPGNDQGVDISGLLSHGQDPEKAIAISGPLPLDGTPYQLTLQGTAFQYGSVGVEVSGRIAGTFGEAPETITAAGSLSSPVELFSGLTLTTLDVNFGETDVTGDFGFAIDTGKQALFVDASGEFTDEENFSLSLELGDNSRSGWQPLPGLTIDAGQFDGSLAAVSGAYRFDVSVGLEGGFQPLAGISVTDVVGEISNDCSSEECPVVISLSGDGEINLSSYGLAVTEKISASGQIDTASGRIELEATLAPVSLGFTQLTGASVVAIHDPTLPEDQENTAYVTGSGQVLGASVTLDVSLLSGGFRADGVTRTTPPGGARPQTVNLVYSNVTGTIDPSFSADPSAPAVTLPANSLTGILPMALPPQISQSLASLVGLSSLPTGYAQYEFGAAASSLDLTMAAPADMYMFGSSSAKSSLRLTTLEVAVAVGDSGSSFTLASDAVMIFGSTTLDMITDVSFVAGETGVSVSGAIELNASEQGGWSNALGVEGLTLEDFAVSVSIDEAGIPGFGIAGEAILPDVVETQLGLVAGSDIVAAMDLGAESPCLALGVTNGGQTAVDIGSGALTATQADFTFAPFGCTIASITYPPGYALDFEGAISGVKADVTASFTLVPDFVFTGSADIGEFDIGALTMTETVLAVDIEPTLQSLALSGGMVIAETTVSASAIVRQSAAGAYYDITAEADPFTISTVVVQKAQLEAQIDLEPTSSSFVLSVAGDMLIGDYPEQANLSVTVANGLVTRFSGNAIVDIPIDAVEIEGSVDVSYVAPGAPSLAFDGTLSVEGRTLESAQGLIDGNGLEITAGLSIPNLASATLEGAIVWGSDPTQQPIDLINLDGSTVVGAKGDYSFVAKNVSFTPGGFSASGDLYLISLAGATSFKGDAHLVVGSEVDVQLSGEFDSDGSYQLAGSGDFDAASGFGFDAQFLVSHAATDYVAISGNLSIPNTVEASVSGTYLKPAWGPSLYTLEGAGTLLVHGQKESLEARLSNDPDDNPGFTGSTKMSFDGLDASGDIIMKPEGMWWIDGSGDLSVPNASASLNFSGGSCNDSSCAEKVTARFFAEGDVTVKAIDFNGKINVDDFGQFTATLTAKGSFTTAKQSIKVEVWPVNYDAQFEVKIAYSLEATLSNSEADVKFSGNAYIENPNRDARTLGITGGGVSGEISTTGTISGSATVDYDFVEKGSKKVGFSVKA